MVEAVTPYDSPVPSCDVIIVGPIAESHPHFNARLCACDDVHTPRVHTEVVPAPAPAPGAIAAAAASSSSSSSPSITSAVIITENSHGAVDGETEVEVEVEVEAVATTTEEDVREFDMLNSSLHLVDV